MISKGHSSKFFLLLMLLFLCCSCGPKVAPLRTAVDAQDWQQALQYAKGNAELEQHLAAMMIESAAIQSDAPKWLVLALPTDIDAGNEAIERLAKRDSGHTAVQLAQIVYYQGTRLSKNPAVKYLKSDDSDVRALAATTLFTKFVEEEQSAELYPMVADIHSTVRGAAVAALCVSMAASSNKKVADLISERLRLDPMPHVRASAARCSKKLGADALMLLQHVVNNDENKGVVTAALRGIYRLESPEAKAFLRAYSKGPMTEQKLWAAVFLARLHSSVGRQRVLDGVDSPNEAVRAAVMAHLGELSQVDGAAVLKDALGDTAPVAFAAAKVMLTVDSLRVDGVSYLKKSWKLGINTIDALVFLGELGDQDAVAELKKRLQSDSALVKNILAFSSVELLRETFVSLLAHEKEGVRLAASKAVLGFAKE